MCSSSETWRPFVLAFMDYIFSLHQLDQSINSWTLIILWSSSPQYFCNKKTWPLTQVPTIFCGVKFTATAWWHAYTFKLCLYHLQHHLHINTSSWMWSLQISSEWSVKLHQTQFQPIPAFLWNPQGDRKPPTVGLDGQEETDSLCS